MKNAPLQVRDYMRYDIPLIAGDTPLSEVTGILCRHQLSGLPVVDESRRLIGFVSEQDCIQALLSSSYHCHFDLAARDVMHADVLTVAPGDSLITLAQAMQSGRPRIYPVVANDQVLGVIHRTQVLTALRENLKACQKPV